MFMDSKIHYQKAACILGTCAGLIIAAGMGAGSHANASERVNEVPVSRSAGDVLTAQLKLYDRESNSWALIDFNDPELVVGQIVAVCAKSKKSGYLSVWSRTLDGARPTRIFPNDFTPEDRKNKGGEIKANTEMCLGDGQQGFGFEVLPPALSAEVYLHWSADLTGQFAPEDIPLIPDHADAASRATNAAYSSAILSYSVTTE